MRNKTSCVIFLIACCTATPARAANTQTTTYIDLAALSGGLQANTTAFSGWLFDSEVQALSGTASAGNACPSEHCSITSLASSATTSDGAVSALSGSGYANAAQHWQGSFTLAPNARLSLVLPYSIVLSAARPDDFSRGSINLLVSSSGGTAFQSSIAFSSFDVRVHAGTNALVNDIALEIVNGSATAISYQLDGRLTAYATNPAPFSAVPEPAGWLMMLGGLALLAGTRASVRSRSAAASARA